METNEALQVLDSIAAQTPMTRQQHTRAQDAVQTLAVALRELVGLRQFRDAAAKAKGDGEDS